MYARFYTLFARENLKHDAIKQKQAKVSESEYLLNLERFKAIFEKMNCFTKLVVEII